GVSSGFGTAPGPQADAYLLKVTTSGSVSYGVYLGGNAASQGNAVAVDPTGYVTVGGSTSATNFPTSGGPFTTNAGGQDGFVSRPGPTATTLSYSTYLGGSGTDSVNGVGLDPLGNAYAVGDTNSTNFPTANPFQGGLSGTSTYDAFVSKIGLKPSPPRITD